MGANEDESVFMLLRKFFLLLKLDFLIGCEVEQRLNAFSYVFRRKRSVRTSFQV